jgi:carboxyl-terminal processing protease
VKVLIKREGEDKTMEKIITREEIKIKSVSYYGMLNKEIGFIRLDGFTENAGNEVREAVMELKSKNELKGLVFDLRGNPGGLLNEAVNIANVFIDKGQEVVTTKGKVKEWDKSYKALNTPIDVNMPIAVLVNSGSASASEIVSGSIQDLDRGVLIGQRTFGKGLVQTTRPLSYNSQLKVTTAKYYIPSGRCIQALDYTHRNEDGSVGKIPDSLTTSFKTKSGRIVYDGGGVVPDIMLEPQKFSNISYSLYVTKGLIFDFATKYRIKHPSISPAKEFRLTDADFNEFEAYIADKDYDYTTRSEKMLEDLKETASKEKYFDNVKTEYEALKTKLVHDKKADLEKNKEEIMQLLSDEIVSRYYFQKGRLECKLSYDPEVKKAIEVLNDKKFYASILDGSFKKEIKDTRDNGKEKKK